MWLLTSLPALLMGRSFDSIVRIYKDQVTLYKWMTLSYPNIYYLFQKTDSEMEGYANFSEMAILLTFFILAAGCVYAVRKKLVNNCKNLLCFSAWIAFTCVMFLPAMHERYGFMAEILVVCYALVAKNVSSYIAAILVNGVAIVNYVGMMFAAIQTPYYLLMVINLTAYSLLTYLVLRQGIGQEKTLI